MAKNTSSSAFRRVDVDQYTEGKYEEDALTDDSVNGPNDMEIQTMLTQYLLPFVIYSSVADILLNFFFFVLRYSGFLITTLNRE